MVYTRKLDRPRKNMNAILEERLADEADYMMGTNVRGREKDGCKLWFEICVGNDVLGEDE